MTQDLQEEKSTKRTLDELEYANGVKVSHRQFLRFEMDTDESSDKTFHLQKAKIYFQLWDNPSARKHKFEYRVELNENVETIIASVPKNTDTQNSAYPVYGYGYGILASVSGFAQKISVSLAYLRRIR